MKGEEGKRDGNFARKVGYCAACSSLVPSFACEGRDREGEGVRMKPMKMESKDRTPAGFLSRFPFCTTSEFYCTLALCFLSSDFLVR